jgi:hypothetical protein
MDFVVRDYAEVIKPDNLLSKKEKNQQKETKLEYLQVGNRFEIIGLETSYRNLFICNISDCSVSVKGEYRERKDLEFKPLNRGYTMALTTRVKRI